jgi:hypothetical protein
MSDDTKAVARVENIKKMASAIEEANLICKNEYVAFIETLMNILKDKTERLRFYWWNSDSDQQREDIEDRAEYFFDSETLVLSKTIAVVEDE